MKKKDKAIAAATVVRQRRRIGGARRMKLEAVDEHGTTPIFTQLRRRSG
jgi:hypothetical protein